MSVLEGKIKRLNKSYGFITPSAGGKDVFFHKSKLQEIEFGMLEEGMTVQYEWERDQRGPRAVSVRITNPPPVKNRQSTEYRFLNPYNFVRYIDKERPLNHVLGDCPPPPQDRYIGLTGRITCEIETKTSLFISDSHNIQQENEGHKSYRFFQYDGQQALPASSLRGMIRSVFETITNSCFTAFQKDDPFPLEHRLSRVPGEMIPARVLELNTGGGALLELLDCSKDHPEKIPERPAIIKSGVIPMIYDPRVLEKSNRELSAFDESKKTLVDGLQSGMRVAALVNKQPCDRGRYQYFKAVNIVPADQYATLLKDVDDKHVVLFGWLYLTGPNIENKHDERLFFRWDDNIENSSPAPPQREAIPESCLHQCNASVVEEYNQHLKEYWERHEKRIKDLGNRPWPVNKEALPHPSNFIAEDNQINANVLAEGDLVYLVRYRGKEMLRSVAIPRVRYNYRRQSFLPKHLSYCDDYSKLCPACRVFGWVLKNGENDNLQKTVSYAGRVRFSHGTIKIMRGTEREMTLDVLSSPKPTATEFYLLNSAGKPDPQVNYNNENAKLRGRKFYHHHAQAINTSIGQKSDQNRTVRDALKPGTIFSFEIDFKNLNRLELGALVYALELGEGMYHRLGYAKPLGFGSINISVERLEMINWQERLTSVAPRSGWETLSKNVSDLKQEFLGSMHRIYGEEQIAILQRELKAVLGKQSLPIHYPRSTSQFDANKPSFEWFVGNKVRKRPGRRELPEPETLPLATDIEKGLPLIDKRGRSGQ